MDNHPQVSTPCGCLCFSDTRVSLHHGTQLKAHMKLVEPSLDNHTEHNDTAQLEKLSERVRYLYWPSVLKNYIAHGNNILLIKSYILILSMFL